MNLSFIRKTTIVLFSLFIVTGVVLFSDDILNAVITPLPQGMKSCLTEKFGSSVQAQSACTGITNENSVAVWGSTTSGTSGKLRESNLFEDYTLGRLTHKGAQGIRFENTANKYGFINAEKQLHLTENEYYDGTTWKKITSGRTGGIQTYLANGEALRVFGDDTTPGDGADTAAANTPLMVVKTSGNVGIGNTSPSYELDVNGDITTNRNNIQFQPNGGSIATDGTYGIYWHNSAGTTPSPNYGIYRTSGDWTASTYQQLKLNWDTGIQLGAGTGVNAGYDKSYVDIVSGKGLMVSAGNLGIGTTAPNGKLDVRTGTGDGVAILQQGDNSTSIQAYIDGHWADRTTYAGGCCNKLALQPDIGEVGIGTSAPSYKFTIGGTGNIFGVDNGAIFVAQNSAAGYEAYFWPRWTDNVMYMNYGSAGYNLRNNSSQSALYFDASRNMQVGGSILCVAGQCPTNGVMRMTPNMHLNTPVGYATIINWDNGAAAAGTQEFRVGNGQAADVFSVTNDKKVIVHNGGILDVRGPGNAGPGVQIFSIGDNGNGLSTPYQIYANGYTGGATNVVHYIPNWTGAYQWYFGSSGGSLLKMQLNQAGTLTVNGATVTSDIRLKKDITPIGNTLDKVLAVEPVEFTWKDNGSRNVGFIAQSIEKIFPLLVATDNNGIKSVEYGNMTAYIIQAFKQFYTKFETFQADVTARFNKQDETISKQQQVIEAQQKQIDNLEKRLEKLEKKEQ
jgi:hypothetical protein